MDFLVESFHESDQCYDIFYLTYAGIHKQRICHLQSKQQAVLDHPYLASKYTSASE